MVLGEVNCCYRYKLSGSLEKRGGRGCDSFRDLENRIALPISGEVPGYCPVITVTSLLSPSNTRLGNRADADRDTEKPKPLRT